MTGGLFIPPAAVDPLWPHQERAFAELRARMVTGASRVIIQIPTGGGKLALPPRSSRARSARARRSPSWSREIPSVDQTLNAFWQSGICCAAPMQADHPLTDVSQPVQVASIQSLDRRKRPDADLIIVDEAHLLTNPSFNGSRSWGRREGCRFERNALDNRTWTRLR